MIRGASQPCRIGADLVTLQPLHPSPLLCVQSDVPPDVCQFCGAQNPGFTEEKTLVIGLEGKRTGVWLVSHLERVRHNLVGSS